MALSSVRCDLVSGLGALALPARMEGIPGVAGPPGRVGQPRRPTLRAASMKVGYPCFQGFFGRVGLQRASDGLSPENPVREVRLAEEDKNPP